MMKADILTGFGTDEDEFYCYVGRKPKDKEEFEDWCHYMEKGAEAQLDWAIIAECAAENFK